MIDTHAHLQDEKYENVEQIIDNAQKAGIENTGNEHIVKRRQQRAAQVNHPALGVIILAIENCTFNNAELMSI